MPNVPMNAPTVPTYTDDNGILRETSSNNPICLRTGVPITDVELHIQAWDDEHPEILFGPYCEEAWPYVKICTKCHTPHMVDDKTDIDYYQNGVWLCSECSQNIKKCVKCNSVVDGNRSVDGKDYCNNCFDKEFFVCDVDGNLYLKENNYAHLVLDEVTIAKYKRLFDEYPHIHVKNFKTLKRNYKPLEVGKCGHCGEVGIVETNGYCVRCINNGYVYNCRICHKDHHVRDDEYGSVCPRCINKIGKSFISLEVALKSEMIEVEGLHKKYYALKKEANSIKDYAECPTCNSMVPNTNILKKGRITYCKNCKDILRICSTCGEPHLGEGFCRTPESVPSVMEYSYRPLPIFHLTPKEKRENKGKVLMMGFENEQSYSSGQKKTKALNFLMSKFKSTELYVKSDSSIHGYGFEVVSHPFTLDAVKTLPLSYLFKTKLEGGDNGCGLHVHLSKTFFDSDMHLYKFVNFINEGGAFTTRIAGRGNVSFSRKIKNVSGVVSKKMRTERYSFVNLLPKNTVEVRIFKGALNLNELKYRLEFCDAVAYFSRDCSIKAGKKEFLQFLSQNKERYPFLYQFLNQ